MLKLNLQKLRCFFGLKQRVLLVAILIICGFSLLLVFKQCTGDFAGEETSATLAQDDSLSGNQNNLIAAAQEAFNSTLTEEGGDLDGNVDENNVFSGIINPGDTASVLLGEWLPMSEVNAIVDMTKDVFPLTQIKAGNPYTIFSNNDGLSRFEYIIDDTNKLIINRENVNRYQATVEHTPYDIELAVVEFIVDSNLFQAVADAGESPGLAIAMADMFGYEVNFIKDLREGDTFTALVEKRYQNGEFKSYGPILAAYMVNQGKQYEGFYFSDGNGAFYFTSDGMSLKRAFLKAPLSFTRVSSGYTMRRLHPILKEVRPHPGIDYAAPTGTPVKAIGHGTVKFVGRGKGAGNYIELTHNNAYDSSYMHLSAFARGLKKGSSVRQGQVIGYVGSTGYSTGPHLDFRMKKSGKYINPAQATSPRSDPIKPAKKEAFKERVRLYRAWLNGEEPLSSYQPFEH